MQDHEHSGTDAQDAAAPVSQRRRRLLKSAAVVAVPAVLTLHAGYARAANSSAVRCALNTVNGTGIRITNENTPGLYKEMGADSQLHAVWFQIDPSSGGITPVHYNETGYKVGTNASFLSTGCVNSALGI